jgi:hypothetical protein
MTVEALAMTICLASGVFGRPAWSAEKCHERAAQLIQIAEQDDLDPMLFVAINIQECDMREDVHAKFYAPETSKEKGKGKGKGKKKPRQLGVDACPMGIRIWWLHGKRPAQQPGVLALYEIAGRKMARWKRWCEKNHKGKGFGAHHHFVSHWNEGNTTYASQVLAFRQALMSRSPKSEEELTPRTKEIVRRLLRAQRERRS